MYIFEINFYKYKCANMNIVYCKMGCDYYIYVYLEIQHKHGVSYYSFPIIRGYYPDLDCGFTDSDDESVDKYYNLPEYNKLYDDMIKMALTPRKPVVIYANDAFVSQKFEIKYSASIQNKLDKIYENEWRPFEDTGVAFNNISEIICITRKEIRRER